MQERIFYDACPLCSSSNTWMFRTGDCSQHPLYDQRLDPVIKWKKCGACGHVFTEGFYSDEACAIIFAKTNDGQKVGWNFEQGRMVSSRMIEKVLPFVSSGAWLDVGFGNGALLCTALEYGFTPIGIDLRSENVHALQQLGITAQQTLITDLELAEPCAVISMADVLEHVPYPKETLAAASRLLDPGGVVLISMPNSESIVWHALTEQNSNPYWGELEHYHNFSRTRLYDLLAEFGFTPKRYGVSQRYRVCMEILAQKT